MVIHYRRSTGALVCQLQQHFVSLSLSLVWNILKPTEGHRGKDLSTETKVEDERQTEEGWKSEEETKRYQWRDSEHSSRLIGELVRLMDRKEDLFGRGQLIRIRSRSSQAFVSSGWLMFFIIVHLQGSKPESQHRQSSQPHIDLQKLTSTEYTPEC